MFGSGKHSYMQIINIVFLYTEKRKTGTEHNRQMTCTENSLKIFKSLNIVVFRKTEIKVINVDSLFFKNILHVSNCYILYVSNLKIKKIQVLLFLEISRK